MCLYKVNSLSRYFPTLDIKIGMESILYMNVLLCNKEISKLGYNIIIHIRTQLHFFFMIELNYKF